MKDNKIIFEVDKEYGKALRKVCRQTLSSFYGLPIEVQDVYNMFLMKVPVLYREWDEDLGVKRVTYLCKYCKYFVWNTAREFTGTHHDAMNKSYTIADYNPPKVEFDPFPPTPFDTTKLTARQIEVYKRHFIEGDSQKKVMADLKMSKYEMRMASKEIRTKLMEHFKN